MKVKIWDLKAKDGPVQIEMWSVDADEAVANDPERYSKKKPEPEPEPETKSKKKA